MFKQNFHNSFIPSPTGATLYVEGIWIGTLDLLELKALNYKIDARGGQGKLTEKLVASGSTVLAVDTGSKHVEIVCNIDLATHVVGTKKCSISCLFAMRKLFLIYIVLMNLLTSQALAEPHDTAILQGLNKVTARV